MFRKILITIICILVPVISAVADQLTLKNNAPTSYVVKKGDTLWDISAVFLKQPWLWPKLWRLNPTINNPHLIYPGDKLRLVYDEQGEPMLVKGKPELKWSPKARKHLKNLNPVSIISLNDIAPFLRYEQVFSQQQVDELPYVLGSNEGHKSSLDSFKLYVNGDLIVGKSYGIYDKGEQIIDPQTQELIGYYAKFVGTGKAIRTGDSANKEPATLYLDSVTREVHSGALVAPVNDNQLLPAYYTMQAADAAIEGKIIESASQNREFAKFDVVMINKGRDILKLGDVMAINRQSPSIVETSQGPKYVNDTSRWDRIANSGSSDYKMPKEIIGNMMIFKLYDKVSMGLILSTQKPVRLQDTVISPL
ncbi:MAG: peptidoglycan-binding protein [Gammaproteobacteria bacterium]|nr:MAG: peptidoglycan-binding protein [Gammaproteobacteria bacterium]